MIPENYFLRPHLNKPILEQKSSLNGSSYSNRWLKLSKPSFLDVKAVGMFDPGTFDLEIDIIRVLTNRQ